MNIDSVIVHALHNVQCVHCILICTSWLSHSNSIVVLVHSSAQAFTCLNKNLSETELHCQALHGSVYSIQLYIKFVDVKGFLTPTITLVCVCVPDSNQNVSILFTYSSILLKLWPLLMQSATQTQMYVDSSTCSLECVHAEGYYGS